MIDEAGSPRRDNSYKSINEVTNHARASIFHSIECEEEELSLFGSASTDATAAVAALATSKTA